MTHFNKPSNYKRSKASVISGVCLATIASMMPLTALSEMHDQPDEKTVSTNEVKDAWLKGKIESAFLFNRHLNPFDIAITVQDSHAILSGTVNTDIEKNLAEEIAKDIDGVSKVTNEIKVDKDFDKSKSVNNSKYLQYWDDVTTTAIVKTKLLMNTNVSGLKIDVTTTANVVTLTGTVSSGSEKDLIIQIVENTDGVSEVVDKIVVSTNP